MAGRENRGAILNAAHHNEIPIIPEEAHDLGVHANRCTLRYQALVNLHYTIIDRIKRLERVALGAVLLLFAADKVDWSAVIKVFMR